MLVLALLACADDSVVENAAPISLEPSAAWRALDLPIGEGFVVFTTDDTITVEYERGTVGALTQTWVGALGERGWTRVLDTSGPTMSSMRLEREGAALALGVFQGIGGVTVTLTRAERSP